MSTLLPLSIKQHLLAASAFCLSFFYYSTAMASPFEAAPVSDDTLNDMRGGFDLPNGMKVSLGVEMTTYVDQSLILRTVLNVTDVANSGLQVTVPSSGANPVIVGSPSNEPIKIEIPSDLGMVTVNRNEDGSSVVLKGPDLEVQHLTGNSTGMLIANTLDNRVIDTITTVNVSLDNSAVPVGNMMLRLDSVISDAGGRVF